ncbi:serine/threonine-protein kinase [Nocardia brasiliensis]|uniref:serine/threonine-protein kinase n=1 Tax=Nocardia brasiliensis TaxID=37326 RepID=UPI002458BE81|nr:serine/threonine-protein kinase [Nocardia brasiliensis]
MTEFIQLEHQWTVIGPIGDQPGMSDVLEVERNGERAVVKKVQKSPGGNRDLLVGELESCRNVLRFDEVYENDSELLIRMPKAEGSLNQLLDASGQLDEPGTIAVLEDVATALLDMGLIVVHRDIKPQNILRYQGAWCLADFGIARYVEEATATVTFKGHASLPWIAPERLVGERATIKSDVYSLGIVAYQLVTGRLPFEGPNLAEQHRNSPPLAPAGASPLLSSLILAMLSKAPGARPAPAQILERLTAAGRVAASPAVAKLRDLAGKSAEKRAQADAAAAVAKTQKEQRQVLAQSSLYLVHEWLDPIAEALEAIPDVRKVDNGSELQFSFESALLKFEKPQEIEPIENLPFDVVCVGALSVEMTSIRTRWAGRSHSLWYCDAQQEGEYLWFETAFHRMRSSMRLEPYSRKPREQEAQLAIAPVMHTEQVAVPFAPIAGTSVGGFVERWLNWFARAAEETLPQPGMLPEGSPVGSWRR